ncbi:MAG: hypothetical protein ACTSRU_12805 [Candidatus Hodarchaeales archaeon]
MNIIEPDEMFAEFLRVNVTEIVRTGVSNRQDDDSQSFNGTGAETEFVLDNVPWAVQSVTVGGVEKKKYTDYNIDLRNKKITFVTAPVSGTNNVVVSYYKTDSWIFPGKPRKVLKKSGYPRINVINLTMGGKIDGIGSTDFWNDVRLQVDILAFHKQSCTIETEVLTDEQVCKYVGRKVIDAVLANFKTDLGNRMVSPELIRSMPMPFDEKNNVFRVMQEWKFEGQNMNT